MTDTEWTITSSPAMQAVEAAAELEHLASTADADRKLIGDDQGPHWQAVEHAEEVLSRHDATALCTVQDLDRQNDARGREISRLRAERAQLLAAADRVHAVLHGLILAEAPPGARARAAWTALDTALIAAHHPQQES